MGHFCTLDDVTQAIAKSNNIILVTHYDPDGDALGSELTLARGLKTLSKKVRVINVGVLADTKEGRKEEPLS